MAHDEVPWLKLGGTFATCEHCGEQEPAPRLPCSLDALIAYLEYVAVRHRDCEARPGDVARVDADSVRIDRLADVLASDPPPAPPAHLDPTSHMGRGH